MAIILATPSELAKVQIVQLFNYKERYFSFILSTVGVGLIKNKLQEKANTNIRYDQKCVKENFLKIAEIEIKLKNNVSHKPPYSLYNLLENLPLPVKRFVQSQ